MRPLRRAPLALLAAAALFVFGTPPAAAQGAREELHSYIKGHMDDEEKSVWDYELIKEIKGWGADTYHNLLIVVSSCCSRGFAEHARNVLPGKFCVTVSRDFGKGEGYLTGTDSKYAGGEGDREKEGASITHFLTYNPNRDEYKKYVHGWLGAWVKELRRDTACTAQSLATAAKDGDYQASRHTANWPGFVSGDDGERNRLDDGPRGRNALIWDAFNGGDESVIAYLGLEACGFNPNNEWNPATLDLAFMDGGFAPRNNRDLRILQNGERAIRRPDAPPSEGPSVPVHFKANRENLFRMLGRLKDGLNANAGQRKGVIVLGGHGNSKKVKIELQSNATPGLPRQGRTMTSGATTEVTLEPDFVQLFLLGSVTQDAALSRDGAAFLDFATSEESAPMSVTVLLDGIAAGTAQLSGGSLGRRYVLPLSNATLQTLHAARAFEDLRVEVRFSMPSGSFRLATDWDFEAGVSPGFGVGLAGPPLATVRLGAPPPLPCAGTLLGSQPFPAFTQSPPDVTGLAYDRSRPGGVVWAADRNRASDPTQPSLFALTPTVTHAVLTRIVCLDSAAVTQPGIARTSGQFEGLAIVPSRAGFLGRRTLLATDADGDLLRFDDHLAEVDPDVPAPGAGAANLRNVWYLDSSSCPATCAPNTNANVPQARIDAVQFVLDLDYIPGEAADDRHQVLLGVSCRRAGNCGAAPWGWFVSLTEGTPGSWLVRGPATGGIGLPGWFPQSATWDPDTQSYWFSDDGYGVPAPAQSLIVEAKYRTATRAFRAIQAFPSFDGATSGLAVVRGSSGPHWMKAVGRQSGRIASLRTGEQVFTLEQDGATVRLAAGHANAGAGWFGLAALTAFAGFPLPDRERRIDLDPDPLFTLSLGAIFGNAGTLDSSGEGAYSFPPLPPGLMFRIQAVLWGDPAENDLGVAQISRMLVYVTP